MGFPKDIADFMAKYGVTADEVWKIPQGNAHAIKHKALERVAAEQNIVWERPAMLECNSEAGIAALCVFGRLGERTEWSIGEAVISDQSRPWGNYRVSGKQAAYVYAMAEKRAKDRVILKLLQVHGALYSEDELSQRTDDPANDTEQPNGGPPANAPKRTKAERETPDDPRYSVDDDGNPINNIPWGDVSIERLPATEARADAKRAGDELIAHNASGALLKWGRIMGNRVDSWPLAWSVQFRNRFEEHKNYLIAKEQQEAA